MPSNVLPLLASIALLLPSPQQPAADAGTWEAFSRAWLANGIPDGAPLLSGQGEAAEPFAVLMNSFDPASAQQVRIEQHLIIRIAPRGPDTSFLMDVPSGPAAPRFYERKTGSCLPVQGIAGVQVMDDRLVLFMRDRRMIGASLDRACRPRDFYSGFYVEHTADGQICAGRDQVHSRAGATCGISRLRELIPND